MLCAIGISWLAMADSEDNSTGFTVLYQPEREADTTVEYVIWFSNTRNANVPQALYSCTVWEAMLKKHGPNWIASPKNWSVGPGSNLGARHCHILFL